MLSIIDQDLKVSFSEILKYSLNIQKPGSFICENIRLPAPIDSTIKQGSTLKLLSIGAIMPAVVKPATVAEPKQTLIEAEISHARTNGFIARL